MKKVICAMLAIGFLGCNDTSGPTSAQAGLATGVALRFGIDRYVIHGEEVSALSHDGVELAHLTLSAPTVDTRLIKIDYPSGPAYSNEITRPVDGVFRAPVSADLPGSIQSDLALAQFFATKQLELTLIPDQNEERLGTSAIASCSDVSFPSGCYVDSCWTSSDYYSGGIHVTQVTSLACCPSVSCNMYMDEVKKTRTCNDPGSCSNQAYGLYGCCACTDGTCNQGVDGSYMCIGGTFVFQPGVECP